MSGTTKSGRLPRLRFPEFRGAEVWKATPLEELGAIVTGKTPSTKEDNLWDGKIFFITPTDITEDQKYQHKTQRTVVETAGTKLLPPGSVVYTCIASIGKVALTVAPSISNQQINAIVPNGKMTGEFMYYSLVNLTPWIKSITATSTLPIINKTQFSGFIIHHPEHKVEQQKIADCLSSLDDLITLEAQKLDSLKAHKKGLMQQLFPREGETQPRLRFPEFQNAGEWEENKLRDFASFFKGKGISKANIATNGRFLCIRYGEIYTRYGEVINEVASRTDMADSELFFGKINDIIIPASGESKLDIAKASCVMLDNVALGSDLNIIRTKHNGTFLSYYLNGPKRLNIAKVAQGDTVAHLYPGQLGKVDLFLPGKLEQQRIASCLTSLDDLITAQTQKLEALKTNKKGLMQQLFPQVSEE